MQKAISIEDQCIYIYIYVHHFEGWLSQIKVYIHALHVHTRPLARDSFRWEPSVAILAPNSPFVPLIGSHRPLSIEPLEPLKTITRSIRSCPRSSLPPFWHHLLSPPSSPCWPNQQRMVIFYNRRNRGGAPFEEVVYGVINDYKSVGSSGEEDGWLRTYALIVEDGVCGRSLIWMPCQ